MSHGVNVTEKSDRQLADLQTAILKEQALRRRLDASPEKIEHAIAEYQKATGKGSGESWVQPVTALQAYRAGAEVEHEGQWWVSTHSSNVHAPGVSGWRLKPELDDDGNEIPPPYVPPTGSHDSYGEGEMITWVDGNIYRAARNGVVHSPDEYAPDWILVEAEPVEPDPPEDDEDDDGNGDTGNGEDEESEPEPDDPGEDDGGDVDPDEPDEPEPEEDLPDEWVQPGGHNPYNTGDRVLWQGSVYESVMDGNVWSPTDYSAGWKLIQ